MVCVSWFRSSSSPVSYSIRCTCINIDYFKQVHVIALSAEPSIRRRKFRETVRFDRCLLAVPHIALLQAGLPCELVVLANGSQDLAKGRYVESLGTARCVAFGNGRNDRLMLAAAGLGIAVIGPEGAAVEALLAAKIAVSDVGAALGLLLNPARLAATLRT